MTGTTATATQTEPPDNFRRDIFRKQLNDYYDQGKAVMQYEINRDCIVARYRHKLYEVNNFTDLTELGNIEISDADGFRGLDIAPITDILSLPNTVEIKHV